MTSHMSVGWNTELQYCEAKQQLLQYNTQFRLCIIVLWSNEREVSLGFAPMLCYIQFKIVFGSSFVFFEPFRIFLSNIIVC